MPRRIVDAARAVRPYLSELIGDAAPELDAHLERLLAQGDSAEVRRLLLGVLGANQQVVDWVARFVEADSPMNETVGRVAQAEADRPFVIVGVGTQVAPITVRDLELELDKSGVSVRIAVVEARGVRGPEAPLVLFQLSASLLAVLEGIAANALWSVLRNSFAHFVRKDPAHKKAKQMGVRLETFKSPDATMVIFEAWGSAEELAAALESLSRTVLETSLAPSGGGGRSQPKTSKQRQV